MKQAYHIPMDNVDDHGGLCDAEALADVEDGDVETLTNIARGMIRRLKIEIDSDMYVFLLEQMELKNIVGISRQKYLSALHRECLANKVEK